ncbi:MAG: group III truncated hemoglobin [Sphingobacteriia bacterium]|nr:group III truncated hemoglobin [Sphingobacteriia bacterium]
MSDKLSNYSNFPIITSKLNITENIITNLINSFYSKVRNDKILGPIFQDKIGDNWEEHLKTMRDFWSGIAIGTGRYKGQPLLKHINLPNLQEEHFKRWLSLFTENAYNTCSKEVAEFFIDRAKKIANSLLQGIEFYRGKEIL